jgi:hypothetical protein
MEDVASPAAHFRKETFGEPSLRLQNTKTNWPSILANFT